MRIAMLLTSYRHNRYSYAITICFLMYPSEEVSLSFGLKLSMETLLNFHTLMMKTQRFSKSTSSSSKNSTSLI